MPVTSLEMSPVAAGLATPKASYKQLRAAVVVCSADFGRFVLLAMSHKNVAM